MRPDSPATTIDRQKQLEIQRGLDREKQRQIDERDFQRQEIRDEELQREVEREKQRERHEMGGESRQSGVGLIIGNQLANPDPVSLCDKYHEFYRNIFLPFLSFVFFFCSFFFIDIFL